MWPAARRCSEERRRLRTSVRLESVRGWRKPVLRVAAALWIQSGYGAPGVLLPIRKRATFCCTCNKRFTVQRGTPTLRQPGICSVDRFGRMTHRAVARAGTQDAPRDMDARNNPPPRPMRMVRRTRTSDGLPTLPSRWLCVNSSVNDRRDRDCRGVTVPVPAGLQACDFPEVCEVAGISERPAGF